MDMPNNHSELDTHPETFEPICPQFKQTISDLMKEKFNFCAAEIALERKPKADKGV